MNDQVDIIPEELEEAIRSSANGFPVHKGQRAMRRAMAINVVTTARAHAGRSDEPYSQSDADVIMAIMELLDRVAEPQ